MAVKSFYIHNRPQYARVSLAIRRVAWKQGRVGLAFLASIALSALCHVAVSGQGKAVQHDRLPSQPSSVRKKSSALSKEPSPKTLEKTDAVRLHIQTNHSMGILEVAFGPYPETVVSYSFDGVLKIWNASSGRELQTINVRAFNAGPTMFEFARLSQDGERLAYGGSKLVQINDAFDFPSPHDASTEAQKTTVYVYDIRRNSTRTFRSQDGSFVYAAFGDHGTKLACGTTSGSVVIYDLLSGKLWGKLTGPPSNPKEPHGITRIEFSADGKYLTTEIQEKNGGDVWNVPLKKVIHHFPNAAAISFISDSKLLALSTDQGVKFWNIASGKELIHNIPRGADSIACSPNGKFLATTSFAKITMWDLDTDKELYTQEAHEDHPICLAFSPDSARLLSGSTDKIAKLWNVRSGELASVLKAEIPALISLTMSHDKKMLASLSETGMLTLWGLANGGVLRSLDLGTTYLSDEAASIVFSPDDSILAVPTGDNVSLLDVATGQIRSTLTGHQKPVSRVVFSHDGALLATAANYYESIKLWDVKTASEKKTLTPRGINEIGALAFSADDKLLAACEDGIVDFWDVATGVSKHVSLFIQNTLAALSPDAEKALVVKKDEICLVNARTEKQIFKFSALGTRLGTRLMCATFNGDGRMLACGFEDGHIVIWNTSTGVKIGALAGHSSPVTTIEFSSDSKWLTSYGQDNAVCLWDLSSSTKRKISSLYALDKNIWVTIKPDGHFDTNDLERVPGLHWVFQDDPFRPLPPEILMRDYYEPRLLSRLLSSDPKDKPGPVRSLASLNRVQPGVKILTVQTDPQEPDQVTVTVEATPRTEHYGEGTARQLHHTEVFDLRLFRDGQIVGQFPTAADPKDFSFRSFDPASKPALAQWQSLTQVKRDARVDVRTGKVEFSGNAKAGTHRIVFTHVRLPHRGAGKEVEFSAYAFNEDRVKSDTDRKNYPLPPRAVAQQGKAYLICMGVNASQAGGTWNLKYAANDATLTSQELKKRLDAGRQFSQVVDVTLLSDWDDQTGKATLTQATRDNFEEALRRLAGKPKNATLLQGVAHANELERATPDDLVLVFVSSHGYTDEHGIFRLFPYNIPTTGAADLKALFAKTISSDDLTYWFSSVDAGQMVLILDACHSGGGVPASFKPGPMGDRGLGQLAYDKGMRILAASQTRDVTLELDALKHGVLTYALIQEGLQRGKAASNADGQLTLGGWLAYGADRVPGVYADAKNNKLGNVKIAPGLPEEAQKPDPKALHQPALFDYFQKTKQADVELKARKFAQVPEGVVSDPQLGLLSFFSEAKKQSK